MNASVPARDRRSLKIFIVEDHRDTLNFLRMYLRNLGHVVQYATTMAEALKAIPTADYDLLISDVGLPDGDGWELMSQLQDGGRPYPLYSIAMSGFGRGTDHIRSGAAGYRHHLMKPFKTSDLDKLLDEVTSDMVAQSAPG